MGHSTIPGTSEVFANTLVRKRIEDGLQESQQRFQTMADTAPVMIWMSGVDKLRTFFNRQWLAFTGRSLDQELGNGWTKDVHPNDLEQCLRTYISSFDGPPALHYGIPLTAGQWRLWLGFRHRRAEIYTCRGIHRLYGIVLGYHRPERSRAGYSRP